MTHIARPITPAIGAEVSGLDLAAPLDESIAAFLRESLARFGVLSLRGQSLSPGRQVEIAALFGRPVADPHPKFGHVDGYPQVSIVINDEKNPPEINVWHADLTFRAQPGLACVLHCIELPATGGDTLWSSMAAAYDALSPAIKRLIEPLQAVHRLPVDGYPLEAVMAMPDRESIHPVVRRHPVSGCACLYVNSVYTREIVGLSRNESRHLLAMLFEHVACPDFQMRYRWQQGSLVIWDNLLTQHYAAADYYPQRRVMHRVAVAP
ncbi:MAG: TauD/TfdA family dioxygenase [Steroidobacteraceae bacterium]